MKVGLNEQEYGEEYEKGEYETVECKVRMHVSRNHLHKTIVETGDPHQMDEHSELKIADETPMKLPRNDCVVLGEIQLVDIPDVFHDKLKATDNIQQSTDTTKLAPIFVITVKYCRITSSRCVIC